MLILSGDSNTCLFAPAPYYKQNKGFFGFLFKPLGGLRPPRGLNEKVSEKHPLSITCNVMSQCCVYYATAVALCLLSWAKVSHARTIL